MPDRPDPAVQTNALRLQRVETDLGHHFQDPDLLRRACTHASRLGPQSPLEQRLAEANERLEFLGDALLGAALCLRLYARFPHASEGELSRWKAVLASREVLSKAIGERTSLLEHCLVGAQLGDRGPSAWPSSVRANLCEGILAAIYLDGGMTALETAVERLLGPLLDDPAHGAADPRMALQEWCQRHHGGSLPTYRSERSGGSDHAPEFTVVVTAGGRSAEGRGTSRKRAEAAAASTLLAAIAGA